MKDCMNEQIIFYFSVLVGELSIVTSKIPFTYPQKGENILMKTKKAKVIF